MVRIRTGAICVSLLIVSSCKFSGEQHCAKESHSKSASSWGIWCVGALCAVPFAALILNHTSDELMLLLQSVIYWFQDRFLTWKHRLIFSLYAVCTRNMINDKETVEGVHKRLPYCHPTRSVNDSHFM